VKTIGYWFFRLVAYRKKQAEKHRVRFFPTEKRGQIEKRVQCFPAAKKNPVFSLVISAF
jgi:hypothetical protein